MADQQSLTGHHALVTGAGRGIGRCIALALAEAGADVAVTARTTSEIEQVATEISAMGRNAIALPCDVTDTSQVARLAASVAKSFGTIDILVNNAGSGKSHKFLNHPDELWHEMLSINLTSVFYVTRAFAPGMVAQKWGRIINIASVASKVGARYIAAYTAAKHGVLGLTRALAVEFVSDGITVNAICPSYVDTPMTDASIENMVKRTRMTEDQAREFLAQTSPQNRLIEPEEVAALTVFLALDSSKGITGQAINVDGGSVMF
jgi:3-hydroxybutyrate dehydrogenase